MRITTRGFIYIYKQLTIKIVFAIFLFACSLVLFSFDVDAQSYSYNLNATFDSCTSSGQVKFRWSWSGPTPPGQMELRIFEDRFSGPIDAEPQVGSYYSSSGNGAYTWNIPQYNVQYRGQLYFFGWISQPVGVISTGPCRADLMIVNESGGSSPSRISGPTSVNVGQAATFTVRTRNIAPYTTASASTTRASTSGSTNNTQNFSVTSLSANTNSAIHSYTTTWNSPGTYIVRFDADVNNNVVEGSESNNSTNISVVVNAANSPSVNGSLIAAPSCVNYSTKYRFTSSYSDSDGAGNILYAYMVINTTSSGLHGENPSGVIKLVLNNQTNEFGVANSTDSGYDFAGNAANPYATLDRSTSSKSVLGNNLTVNWDITFNSAWASENSNVFLRVRDSAGSDTNFEDKGDVQIPCPPVVQPPANPIGLVASPSCNGSQLQVQFRIYDNSASEDLFWFDVNGAEWTGPDGPSPWAVKTVTRTSAQKAGRGNVIFLWTVTSPLDVGDANPALAGGQLVPEQNKTYWWRVRAHSDTDGDSAHVYAGDTLTPPGTSFTTPTCPPNVPIDLFGQGSCFASETQILFRFYDNSNNEDQFVLEVNDRPWTSSGAGPVPWGVKTFNSSPAQKVSAARQFFFVWRNSAPLESGNANGTGGAELVPVAGKTYWWRVRAVAGGVSSANMYPGPLPDVVATATPPGISVQAPVCQVDLSVTFDQISWRDSLGNDPGPLKKFEPREKVTVNAIVQKAPGINSPATDLYVYYKDSGNQMPDCSLSPPRAASSIPSDSSGQPQRYAIPTLTDSTPTTTVNISISLDSISGTVYAFVVPRCEFDSAPWNNNVSSQTYIIDTAGFIESRGGDVGAVGNISMAVKSSTLTPPIYQSDYIVSAQTMSTNVDSKNNWIMKQYSQRLLPKGGLYEYFDTKFKSRTEATCSFSHSAQFRNCSGNLTFNAVDTPPNAPLVFFVEGDLRFMKDFVLGGNSAVLFLVKGNVVVDLSVKRIDAFIVTKGKFTDTDAADAGVAIAGDALVVNGAVFSEKTTDAFELKRYFLTPINKSTPANVFVWDPRQLMILSDLVGSSSIVWKEVAP